MPISEADVNSTQQQKESEGTLSGVPVTNPLFCHLQEAVQTLNSLQTNAADLQRIRQDRASLISRNISAIERYLKKVEVSLDDLDKLSVIHVAGEYNTCQKV